MSTGDLFDAFEDDSPAPTRFLPPNPAPAPESRLDSFPRDEQCRAVLEATAQPDALVPLDLSGDDFLDAEPLPDPVKPASDGLEVPGEPPPMASQPHDAALSTALAPSADAFAQSGEPPAMLDDDAINRAFAEASAWDDDPWIDLAMLHAPADEPAGIGADPFQPITEADPPPWPVESPHPLPAAAPPQPSPEPEAPDPAPNPMREQVQAWVQAGQLRPLELALADFLLELEPAMPPLALLGAVLASHQLGRGHVCLDLAACLRHGAYTLGWQRPADAGDGAGPDGPPALPTPMDCLHGVALADWQAQLAASTQVQAGEGASPLVLSGPRLYLRRPWQDERTVRAAIAARVQGPAARALREAWSTDQWRAALAALFPSIGAAQAMDWQQAACAMAASQGFAIVTGGPGTGKTTTVVRLLALLQAMALSGRTAGAGGGRGVPLRIALAAPTGKAAARLGESISGALGRLDLSALTHVIQSMGEFPLSGKREINHTADEKPQPFDPQTLLAAIPTGAQTLHRLLGPRADSRHFWHHAHNPLPLDVLVVDEASMVDLDLMARLVQALPQAARLVLLGDKDQLASVEAGAVLGELCSRAGQGHFSAATADWLHAVTGRAVPPALCDAQGTPLDQAVVMLRQSHRFGADSGIGQLAAAVNAGDAATVHALRERALPDLQWLEIAGAQEQGGALARLVRDGHAPGAASDRLAWAGQVAAQGADPAPPPERPQGHAPGHPQGHAHYLGVMRAGEAAWRARLAAGQAVTEAELDAWALAVLGAQRQFQLLCALRQGAWGVDGLNRRITRWLADAGLVAPHGTWWAGRPVMVTANDYGLGLMNGDIGVTLARPAVVDGASPPGASARAATRLAVAFAAPERPGGVRWVAPSRLTQVDTVFAMTVHKSQGSEFTHAALVVPPVWSPVLTRELVYTGITRASRWCSLVLAGARGQQVLETAVQRRVQRASGLLADA